MFSFDGGLRVLTDTLADRLGGAILLNCPVEGIERVRMDGAFILRPALNLTARAVCSPRTVPGAPAGPDLTAELRNFEQVYYPPSRVWP